MLVEILYTTHRGDSTFLVESNRYPTVEEAVTILKDKFGIVCAIVEDQSWVEVIPVSVQANVTLPCKYARIVSAGDGRFKYVDYTLDPNLQKVYTFFDTPEQCADKTITLYREVTDEDNEDGILLHEFDWNDIKIMCVDTAETVKFNVFEYMCGKEADKELNGGRE